MEFLPLSERVLLILVSLAEGPRHGYSILKDVASVSDGRALLSTGTLSGSPVPVRSHIFVQQVVTLKYSDEASLLVPIMCATRNHDDYGNEVCIGAHGP